jgi:outer membrane biosynthesis protein TonB
MILKYLTLTILVMCCITPICVAQEKQQACDFSKYKPIRLSDDVGLLVKSVKPAYPQVAKAARVQGDVIVEVLINRIKGDVVQACVVKGHPLLSAAARKAALEFKFIKATASSFGKGGLKYRTTILTFNFRPN